MLFNSYGFILGFLPLSLFLFFQIRRRWPAGGQMVLLLLSLVFLCSTGPYHALAALASAAVSYLFYRSMARSENRDRKRHILVWGVSFHVALLCLFKFVPSQTLGLPFPLGLSFYTFQQIAFLADAAEGRFDHIRPVEYLLSILFFPKAVQGPIPYGGEILPQLRECAGKGLDPERFARSLYLFSMGLAKKVLVADKFALIADHGFGVIGSLTAFEALLTILAYTFQLYFDFSGYSDMAVAVGWMFGIDLPLNFNSPYKATNITDFWRRWHITLSRFLTRYIYIPLGGNRRGLLRTCLNILVVYLVSGIWHGTGVTFLIWGLLHAAASIAYRLAKEPYDRLPGFLRWGIQFSFINLTWVFFRAPSLESAFALLRQLGQGSWFPAISSELAESLMQPTFISVVAQFLPIQWTVLLGFAGALAMVVFCRNSNEYSRTFRPGIATLLVTYLLLICSILSLSGVSSFLYTNF